MLFLTSPQLQQIFIAKFWLTLNDCFSHINHQKILSAILNVVVISKNSSPINQASGDKFFEDGNFTKIVFMMETTWNVIWWLNNKLFFDLWIFYDNIQLELRAITFNKSFYRFIAITGCITNRSYHIITFILLSLF